MARRLRRWYSRGCNELRHEFILPEWCLPARAVCGASSGASDKVTARSSSQALSRLSLTIHASNQWAWRISEALTGGVGPTSGDTRRRPCRARAAGVQPAQGRRQEKDYVPREPARCSWAAP